MTADMIGAGDMIQEAAGVGFDGYPTEATEMASPQLDLPVIVDGAALLKQSLPAPPELVHGLLHQGSKMVLGGGSKTFKTWTLLDPAVAVAAGEPWLSFKTTKGRVLFLNFEIQLAFLQQRLQAVTKEKGVTLAPGQLDLWNLRGHSASYHDILPLIKERVKNSRYSLIILDPVYKLYGDTDENSAMAVAKLLNALESLAVETGAAVAFGAHYSKGNQSGKEAIDRISGSGVFARDPDTILGFNRHEEQDAFTVEATLRNLKPVEPFCVRWRYPLMRRDAALDPARLKRASGRRPTYTAEGLITCLKGQRLNTQDWFKRASLEIHISKSRFFSLKKDAEKHPNVKQDQSGQWFYDDSQPQQDLSRN
jgi:hypothetical protein